MSVVLALLYNDRNTVADLTETITEIQGETPYKKRNTGRDFIQQQKYRGRLQKVIEMQSRTSQSNKKKYRQLSNVISNRDMD